MKKTLLICLLVNIIFLGSVYAQQRTVSGTIISSDDKQPLPGVSVRLKGSNEGTQSETDGKYSIKISGSNPTLVFTYIGYATQEISVNQRRSFNVSLVPASNELSEVVVVGYGTQQRKDLTGSAGSVSGAQISNLATPSLDKQLPGRIPGVQASVASGILGQATRLRIRGTNSISNSSDPLYVVDGVPMVSGNQSGVTPTNPLSDINPNDIESIDVLKDGSATAIYGSRAANGVVMITTKKGTKGKPKVSYDSWYSVAQTVKRFDLLNASEFITIANEKFANTVPATAPQAFNTINPTTNQPYDTNWQNAVFHSGFQQSHNLSLSGATDQTNYFFSASFSNQDGALLRNSLRRYQFRAKLEQKMLDRITFGFNGSTSVSRNTGFNSGTNALSGNITSSIRAFPNVPIFNADGSYNLSADLQRLGRGSNIREIDDNYTNAKYTLDNNIFRNQNVNLIGDAFVDVKIIEGLNAKSLVGINGLYGEDYLYYNPVHGDGRGSNGLISQQFLPTLRYNWANTLNYSKIIAKDHSINALAGFEIQKSKIRSFSATGTGLSNTFFTGENIISNTLTTPTIGGGILEQAYKSFFGRLNYSYKDRYILSGTIRRDAISALSPGSQYATFPGASAGWRLSNEQFFKDSKTLSFISDLKLRGSYGKVGNTEIGYYPFAGTFGAAQYGLVSGVNFTQVGNPQLRFESSKKTDIGVDIGLFKNRISITADYFRNNLDDLVLSVPTSPSLGVPGNSYAANIGRMSNKGFEFQVNSNNITTEKFSWSTTVNLTLQKNKVLATVQNQDIIGTYNITRVGESIGAIFGYQYEGVNPANGNPLYRKSNGQVIQGAITSGNGATANSYWLYDPSNPNTFGGPTTTASVLSATADKVVLGNTAPTYFGGIDNTFNYKGFDLNVFFTFSGGNKVFNVTRQESLMNQSFNNNGSEILNRWTPTNTNTVTPKVVYGQNLFINLNGNASSRFLESGKFIRAQNIGLGYTLPLSITERLKLNKVRLYAQVQNAFWIGPYSGLDPELNISNTSNQQVGVDYNTNPTVRNITFGLNIGL